MANMTSEERQQLIERFQRDGPQSGREGQPARTGKPATPKLQSAQTIDSLFGPLPRIEGRGRVWLYINKQLKPVLIRTGISDGTWTEVLDERELQPNMEVVTNVITGQETANRPTGGQPTNNPLMPPQRGGPGRGR
jgi:hypothetical protein